MDIRPLLNVSLQEANIAVVLDVGSASIGGSLVLFSPQKTPEILYSIRKDIPIKKNFHLEDFIRSMTHVTEHVLKDLNYNGISHLTFTKWGKFKPQSAYCFFSSPWHASHIKTVVFSQEIPFRVSKEMLSDIFEKELHAFEKLQSDQYKKEGLRRGDTHLMEKEIIRIKLNGYKVENPIGKEAKHLEASVILSIVPEEITSGIKKKIEKTFDINTFHFHSSTLASFSVIRDIWNNENDFLLLEISGEVTEVSLAKDSALVRTISFPFGRNVALREVARILKLTTDEALSMMRLYVEKKVHKEEYQKVERALSEVEAGWLKEFHSTLARFREEKRYIPRHIFLMAGEPLGLWFKNIIQKGEATTEDHISKPFTVNLMHYHILTQYVHGKDYAKRDPFLLIDAISAQKFSLLKK